MQAQYTQGNRLLRIFSKCSEGVKIRLFRAHCSSFYGAHLWCKYTKSSIQAMKVAYNNSFRFLLGLRRDCSISRNQVENNVLSFNEWRRKLVHGFMSRLAKSGNTVVRAFDNTLYQCYESPLVNRWHDLLHT